MTNPRLTDITILLDASWSMQSIRQATLTSLRDYLREQDRFLYENPGLAMRISLHEFNSDPSQGDQLRLRPVIQGYDLRSQGLSGASQALDSYLPRGNTPLLDAAAELIAQTGKRYSLLPEQERPGRVLFVILTDGAENTSTRNTWAMVKKMIERQTKDYSWAFVFLGANMDSFAVAGQLGVLVSNTANWAASEKGVQDTTRGISRMTCAYASGEATGTGLNTYVTSTNTAGK